MAQTIGKRIMEHRKRLGITQDTLAEQLGVTAQAVSKWENDQSCPDITMLPKLAEFFGVTTAELLDVSLCGDVTEEECLTAMNRVLPPELAASRVRLVDDRFPKVSASLRTAQYRIILHGEQAKTISEKIADFLNEEEIMALRKTKKNETLVNIRPMIHELTAQYDEENARCVMIARVSFVELATLKPDLLLEALSTYCGVELPKHEIRRTLLLGEVDGQCIPLIDM